MINIFRVKKSVLQSQLSLQDANLLTIYHIEREAAPIQLHVTVIIFTSLMTDLFQFGVSYVRLNGV